MDLNLLDNSGRYLIVNYCVFISYIRTTKFFFPKIRAGFKFQISLMRRIFHLNFNNFRE